LADSCQVNVQTQQGCKKDSPILINWLILRCETHHFAMGWNLIIALFKAQSIQILSSETANENNCGEKAQNRSRDFIGIKITGHI
jgi:hypothetical protein